MNKQRKRFHQNCRELLELTDDLLRKNGLDFWLNYGTLLGAYRDHDFIAHDYDLDVALYWGEHERVKEIMLNAGLLLKDEVHFGGWENPECVEYRFEYKGAYIDFNFYKIEGNIATTYNPQFIENVELKIGDKVPVIAERIDNPFCGLKDFEFLGRIYKIPSDIEGYLIANYGENYMTPIKDFNYHEFANNIYAFSPEEKSGYIQVYY